MGIWLATRPEMDATFGTPVRVAALSTTGEDHVGWISPDGQRLYTCSDVTGTFRISVASRSCK
jgi:hypothetical protein